MSSKEFKNAVEFNDISGLKQPEKFMKTSSRKTFDDYLAEQQAEQDSYQQAILSVAVEPTLKKLVQEAGKKVGRNKGGSKAIVREALKDYFIKHTELFD